MKRNLLTLSSLTFIVALAAACGGNSSTETSGESTATSNTTVAATQPEPMKPGEKLINKADCIGCHNKTQKIIGPAYVDIAAKYEATDKNIDMLAGKIIDGGKGVWGELAMTPHAGMSKDDAKEMVKYILSLKQ